MATIMGMAIVINHEQLLEPGTSISKARRTPVYDIL